MRPGSLASSCDYFFLPVAAGAAGSAGVSATVSAGAAIAAGAGAFANVNAGAVASNFAARTANGSLSDGAMRGVTVYS